MKKSNISKESIFWCFCFFTAGFSTFLIFIMFLYPDLRSITAWSFDWLDCLLRGNLGNYYSWQKMNRYGAWHITNGGNYYPVALTSLWNIPAYVLYTCIGKGGELTAKYYYWQKLSYVVLIAVTIRYICKIVKIIAPDVERRDRRCIALLMISSPSIIFSCMYFGQDEIYYVAFFVVAVWAYLNAYWKRFVALSTLVVSTCPLMILPVLLMLVMKEKRIVWLSFYGLLMIGPTLLFGIIYKNDPVYSSYKISLAEWANQMMSLGGIHLQYGMVSVSGVALVILFLYCYVQKGDLLTKESMLYSVSLIMILIGFGTNQLWYRYLLASPFLVILVFMKKRNRKLNLFLLWLITICRGVSQLSDYRMLNPEYLINNRLANSLVNLFTGGGFRWKESLHNALNYGNREGDLLLPIVGCVCYATLIILVWINRPSTEKEYDINISEETSIVGISCVNLALLIVFFVVGGPGWRWVISG